MTFRKQLIVGECAALLVTLIIALTAILALDATTERVDGVTQRFADNLERSEGLRLESEQLVATSRALLLTGRDEYQRKFDALGADFERLLRRLEIDASAAENTQRFAVQRDAAAYVAAVQRAARARASAGDLRELVTVFEEQLTPLRAAFEASVTAFAREEQRRLERSIADAEALSHRAQVTLAVAAAVAIAIGALLASIVHRRLRSEYERVQEATVAANRAAAARKELLAIVSHDLRNPLNAIMLAAGMLETTSIERRHVGTITNAAERMRHLIDELVDVARIESGTIQLAVDRFEVGPALDLVVGMFAETAVRRSITLRANAALPSARGDRERILQVLSNLVSNALRFVPPGGAIELRAARTGDRVRFTVADTGPGIAEPDVAHVFDRHWQGRGSGGTTTLDGNRTAPRAGLGLGLFICKGLVEAHGGRIGVDSRLGEGAAFWFELPDEPATPSATPGASRPATASPR